MGVPYKTIVTLAAASPNAAALSQALGAAGPLTLNGALASGGVVTFDRGRRLGITSSGNDSTLIWTITGTNSNGAPLTERLAGSNAGTAQSLYDYATVTRIAGSRATAGTVTAGTTATGSSPWWTLDFFREGLNVGIALLFTGTATATVEYTYDDPNGAQAGSFEPASNLPPIPQPHISLTNVTANTSAPLTFPVLAVRLTVTAGAGTVQMQLIQSGTHL